MLSRDPLFNELFSGLRAFQPQLGTMPNGNTSTWSPATDVHETEDTYIIEADVPGVRLQDLNIEVDRKVLTIRAVRHRRHGDGASSVLERSFKVPDHVDVDNIHAALEEGVLVLTMPKLAEAKPRRIEIQAKPKEGLLKKLKS